MWNNLFSLKKRDTGFEDVSFTKNEDKCTRKVISATHNEKGSLFFLSSKVNVAQPVCNIQHKSFSFTYSLCLKICFCVPASAVPLS